nr:unnamed protein product [Callosobruchus chinensis]CAH7765400.1 unnamed protein product [Callosobruchus chinensis]
MKLFYFLFVVLMAVLGIQSANGQCIKNGATCKSDGSIGNCCSGYCYQIAGASSGVCQ